MSSVFNPGSPSRKTNMLTFLEKQVIEMISHVCHDVIVSTFDMAFMEILRIKMLLIIKKTGFPCLLESPGFFS